jgi:DNA (cytosine-5)-methyltransferase 1
VLRNNCDAISLHQPAATVAAAGEHQALITPPLALLAAYYGNGTCSQVSQPVPTHPTRDRFGLVAADVPGPEVDDCTFRMLDVPEIQKVMGFPGDYRVLGTRRDRVLQLGNAVTPPAARLLLERVLAADGAAA